LDTQRRAYHASFDVTVHIAGSTAILLAADWESFAIGIAFLNLDSLVSFEEVVLHHIPYELPTTPVS
jgi:hypothetical protein